VLYTYSKGGFTNKLKLRIAAALAVFGTVLIVGALTPSAKAFQTCYGNCTFGVCGQNQGVVQPPPDACTAKYGQYWYVMSQFSLPCGAYGQGSCNCSTEPTGYDVILNTGCYSE
jgi:hypothetical protein